MSEPRNVFEPLPKKSKEKIERKRAMLDGTDIVTVISGDIGGKIGKTEIRDAFGFKSKVRSSRLSEIEANDPVGTLKFEFPQD